MPTNTNTQKNCDEIRKLAVELMNATMQENNVFTSPKYLKLKDLFESIQSKKHWKDATGYPYPMTFEQAVEGAAAIAWFHGGVEIAKGKRDSETCYAVYSKGYHCYCD